MMSNSQLISGGLEEGTMPPFPLERKIYCVIDGFFSNYQVTILDMNHNIHINYF